MVVSIIALVSSCDTSAQGRIIYNEVSKAMSTETRFTVDFVGVSNMTTSFVNTAFVPLLHSFPFDVVKERMAVVGANRQVATLLRDRMSKESKRIPLAA